MGRLQLLPVAALGAAAYFSHTVLPVALRVAARRRSGESADPLPQWRFDADDATDAQVLERLRVVVPAYREAGELRTLLGRLDDAGVAPDRVLVLVDGDEETRDAALAAGVDVDWSDERRGKAGALNAAFVRHHDDDVLVCMDANVSVGRDDLVAVARPVLDGRLAVAGGVKAEAGSTGEELYWRFESAIVAAENDLGGSLAVVGELLAVDPGQVRPLPDLGVNDDQWLAVDAALRGLAVGVVPGAVARERSAPSGEQRERRARIAAGVLRLLRARGRELATSRSPAVRLFLLHKAWRLTVGPLAQVLLVAYCARHARRSWLARAVVAGHAAGVAAYLRPVPRTAPRPARVAGALLAQGVGMPLVVTAEGGWRVLRDPAGDPRWRKAAR